MLIQPRRKKPGKTTRRLRGEFAIYIAVVAIALLLLWLSVAISVAGVFRNSKPDVALTAWSGDGIAKARLAERMARYNSTDSEGLRALAAEAFLAEPTAVRAVRLMALISRDPVTMRRRFAYSRQLSRRDLPTNLFFIQDALQRNDLRGAMGEFNIALSTSGRTGPQVLFPLLDGLIAQRSAQEAVGELLSGGGEWVPEFVAFSVQNRINAAQLALILTRYPDPLSRVSDLWKGRLLDYLVEQKQFDRAAGIYDRIAPEQRNVGVIRNPSFDLTGRWPPFDWATVSDGSLGSSIPTGGSLQLYSRDSASGTVARQLIKPGPGQHLLSARLTVLPQSRSGHVRFFLSCAGVGAPAVELLRSRPQQAGPQILSATVTISAGCPWYWLSINVSGERLDGVVEWVSLAPLQR